MRSDDDFMRSLPRNPSLAPHHDHLEGASQRLRILRRRQRTVALVASFALLAAVFGTTVVWVSGGTTTRLQLSGAGETVHSSTSEGRTNTLDVMAEVEVIADSPNVPDEPARQWYAIAADTSALTEQWRRFRLESSPPALDSNRQVALFAGFGESSTCPFVYAGTQVNVGESTVQFINASNRPEGCTDDFVTRTIVVVLDRTLLPSGPFYFRAGRGEWSLCSIERVNAPSDRTSEALHGRLGGRLTVDPRPVDVRSEMTVALYNTSPDLDVVGRRVRFDQWTGTHWQAATPPELFEVDAAPVDVSMNTRVELLTIDLASLDLAPGWYRVVNDDNYSPSIKQNVELVN